MKKTEYFIGTNHSTSQLESAINSAIKKRNFFLESNKEKIAKIESEEIILTTWGGNNSNVITTIKLTYYPKQ